jgi:hypothetical protein
MKREAHRMLWLLVIAGAVLALGAGLRSPGGVLVGIALALVALSVALKPLRAVLTVLVSVVLSLALAEFVLGFLQRGESARTYFDSNSDVPRRYWHHTDIGSVPRPGVHTARKLTSTGELVYDVRYSIGDDGFRVTPGAGVPGAGRVNVFGCSMVFGEGLNDRDTLPAQLKQKLGDVPLKDFSIQASGMHQVLAILESRSDTSGKVNFVMTAPWHAERSACVPPYALGSPSYRLRPDGTVQRAGMCGAFDYYPLARALSVSRVYNLIKDAVQAGRGQDRQIDLYLALIQEIARQSGSRHQDLIVGFMKARDDWYTGSYTNDRILDRLKSMNVQVIDVTLSDRFETLAPQYMLHELDEHPTALANEKRVALILDAVVKGLAK